MNDTATAELQLDIDPVTASVIQGALENIAVEMGYKLMRMSYSLSLIHISEPRDKRQSRMPSSA